MITIKQFVPAVKFVSHAMANADVRYFLNGMLLEVTDSTNIRLVATDGHRLAKIDLETVSRDDDPKEHGIPEGKYILSTDLVKDIVTSFKIRVKDLDSPVTIKISQMDLTISTPDRTICGKLVDGTFPDYARVIPDLDKPVTTVGGDPVDWSNTKIRQIGVNCNYMEQAFKACQHIANDRGKGVILHMRGSNSCVAITAPDNSELNSSGALVVVMPMKL